MLRSVRVRLLERVVHALACSVSLFTHKLCVYVRVMCTWSRHQVEHTRTPVHSALSEFSAHCCLLRARLLSFRARFDSLQPFLAPFCSSFGFIWFHSRVSSLLFSVVFSYSFNFTSVFHSPDNFLSFPFVLHLFSASFSLLLCQRVPAS